MSEEDIVRTHNMVLRNSCLPHLPSSPVQHARLIISIGGESPGIMYHAQTVSSILHQTMRDLEVAVLPATDHDLLLWHERNHYGTHH